jgi:uncharacterized lipoprotein
MKTKIATSIFICLVLISCATAPAPRMIQNSFSIDQPFDKIWPAVIEVFAELNLPIMNMEKDSGLITTDWIQFTGHEANRFMDCGRLGATTEIDKRGKFNVYVKKISDTACEMKVNSVFEHTITPALGMGPLVTSPCVSNGKLEAEVYKRVTDKMN